MRRVIYISRSQVATDAAALDSIMEISRVRNAAAGVSGMLWAGPGEFVQALEGEDGGVAETMARIAADTRHCGIEIVCDLAVRSRMFGAWAMVRSDGGAECTAGTAYLIGYAGGRHSRAARRVVDLLLSGDG